MENPEGVLNLLDEFAKVKSKEIPNDLEEYLLYVAASGDPVYQWSLIKSLYRQKLINVITEFYENCPMMDIPACPNVDPFNYETMKNSLIERLDSFASAPFTIQRISELLTTPMKQYNRVDKFMRAIEKNIWVVSTREPGQREAPIGQEVAGNLVNGVATSVRVTVKYPKRGKSIEERIKSGHPQLIDDDEEDEEDESMESKSNSELLPNNDTEDTPLQCTAVKDLLEKYENGTIFCATEEKTVQLEESAISGDSSSSLVDAARGTVGNDNTSEQESDEEEVNIEKLVTSDKGPKIELVEISEGDKLSGGEEEKNNAENQIPLIEIVKENCGTLIDENDLTESSGFSKERIKPDTTEQAVMEALGIENEAGNDTEPLPEEPGSDEFANVPETSEDKSDKTEVKVAASNEAEAAVETKKGNEKINVSDGVKENLDSISNVVELEPDSSSPDERNAKAPILIGTVDFIVKEPSLGKELVGETVEDRGNSVLNENKETLEKHTSSEFENFSKENESSRIEEELCLQNDLTEAKMDESDLDEKSSEMIVEETEKIDEMEVDESNTNSPMADEEVLEPMDDSDVTHS